MFENGENLDINSEKGIKILCDYNLLLTLLRNLIENAFRFSDGQKVIVKIERSGNCCRSGVADSGRGMTQEEIRRAAEPFIRRTNPEAQRVTESDYPFAKAYARF